MVKDQPARLLQFRHMFFLSIANTIGVQSVNIHVQESCTIDTQRSIEFEQSCPTNFTPKFTCACLPFPSIQDGAHSSIRAMFNTENGLERCRYVQTPLFFKTSRPQGLFLSHYFILWLVTYSTNSHAYCDDAAFWRVRKLIQNIILRRRCVVQIVSVPSRY